MKKNTIKTNNIEVGDCLTYNKLCTRLSTTPRSGNGKKVQIKEWKRYFDYNRDGTKYIITEIYDEPLPKEYKYPANAIYIKSIEYILMSYLSEQDSNEAYIASQSLWKQLGMINDRFITMQNNQDALLSLDQRMNSFYIINFYKRCKSRFYDIVKKSLDSLQQRFLIKYDDNQYMIKRDENDQTYSIATTDEIEQILSIERDVLLDLGLEKKQQIFLKNLSKQFYSAVNAKCKELYGWTNVYKCYHIIYNQKNITQALPDDKVQLQKLLLNEEIQKSMNKQATTLYSKQGYNTENYLLSMMDYEESDDPNKKMPFFYPENYIEMQELLADTLIKIK